MKPHEDIFDCNKCKKETIQTVFEANGHYGVICRRCGRVDELEFYLEDCTKDSGEQVIDSGP